MSRTKKVIDREPYYDEVEDVYIKSSNVGQIIRWIGTTKSYLSWRKHQKEGAKGEGHYFIKHRGWGIDEGLFWDLVYKYKIELIIIKYKGPKGVRFFISNIDDWAEHGKKEHYTKRFMGIIETYSKQIILCEDYMDELEIKYSTGDVYGKRREYQEVLGTTGKAR